MIGGSAGASDGTLESRRFIMQNWRADVVCTASATGAPLERVRYSAYGVPTLVRVSDYNQDGGLDYNDYDAFYADWEEQTGIAADLNLDGVINMADHDVFSADYSTNSTKIGRTHQSAYGVRKGYAGYENDGVITRFSHVRHRVYDNELAMWTRSVNTTLYTENSSCSLCSGRANVDTSSHSDGKCIRPKPGFFVDLRAQCDTWTRCIMYKDRITPSHPCFQNSLTEGISCCLQGFDEAFCRQRILDALGGCVAQNEPCYNVQPQPPDEEWCNSIYPPCYQYAGANARCFCMCGGNGDWANYIRACLACMYKKNIGSHDAHIRSYAEAYRRYPGPKPWMGDCYLSCVIVQRRTCGQY